MLRPPSQVHAGLLVQAFMYQEAANAALTLLECLAPAAWLSTVSLLVQATLHSLQLVLVNSRFSRMQYFYRLKKAC